MEVNCEFKAIRTGICPFHTKAIKKKLHLLISNQTINLSDNMPLIKSKLRQSGLKVAWVDYDPYSTSKIFYFDV